MSPKFSKILDTKNQRFTAQNPPLFLCVYLLMISQRYRVPVSTVVSTGGKRGHQQGCQIGPVFPPNLTDQMVDQILDQISAEM